MNRYKLFFISLIIYIIVKPAVAGDKPDYKVSIIPAELTKNAKAVVRNNEIIIDAENNSATEKHTLAITVMNKNGYDLCIFHEFYDAFSSISGISAKVFDSEGKKVKSLGAGDVIDHSAISGFSLYEDNRVKYLDPQYRNYPFTVEYTFKKKLKSLMFLPVWQIYPDYNCAIEKSSLVVNLLNGTKVRYYEKNLPNTCVVSAKEEIKVLTWSVTNLSAISDEAFDENLSEYTPVVLLSPEEFEVDGVKGDFKSWKAFGNWIIALNKNLDVLPMETVKKLQDLTKGLTVRQKVEKIYEYMQQHARYVSIQVGIGGWQPFDASTVDRLAYGDCKALSNYTYSLLKAVSIPSFYTLINAGKDAPSIIDNLPSQFFNHVILTVPVENDTLFLECTSPYLPYGHIGSFTDNRKALMITDSGGVLINTRIYKPEENLIARKSVVIIDNSGSGSADMITTYSGVNFDKKKYLSVQSNEDIKKQLYSELDISNYIISDFSFNQPDKTAPVITESLKMSFDRYASLMNKKLILPLNLANRITEIPNITEQRKSDIVIRRPETEIDTIEYQLPTGYSIDKLPQEYNINSDFANYQAKCINFDDKAIYIRKLNTIPGRFKPSEASKFIDFYTKVSQADMVKLTLLKK